ncbi:MAG: glycerol-3-phosphate acyltransferase [Syntrophaceticus sp.]
MGGNGIEKEVITVHLLLFLVFYLLGSIPVAYLAGKLWRGIDIREYGSGNVGTMNTRAVLGWGIAILVFLLDVGKGILAVYIARIAGVDPYLALLLAVTGDIYPIWLKWQGGKGLAAGLGGLLLEPQLFPVLIFCTIWGCCYLPTRDSDWAGLTASLAFTAAVAWKAHLPGKLWLVLLGSVVAWKHLCEVKRGCC